MPIGFALICPHRVFTTQSRNFFKKISFSPKCDYFFQPNFFFSLSLSSTGKVKEPISKPLFNQARRLFCATALVQTSNSEKRIIETGCGYPGKLFSSLLSLCPETFAAAGESKKEKKKKKKKKEVRSFSG
jgi:hypothetical protein